MTELEKELDRRAKIIIRQEKRIEELETENRLLGERCNQLLKDKGELTDKIADIKANCDLAIEGRDIKIKELEDHLAEEVELHLHAEEYIKSLEQKLEQTEKELADYQFNYPKIKELEKENAELKKKIGIYQKGMYDEIEKRDKKLTKAKEIIKTLADDLSIYSGNYQKELLEARQFLKEIEE